jgi:hypothetical protein
MLVIFLILISPNGDFINDTWILPQKYVDGTNTQILIISANGILFYKLILLK